MEEVRMRAATIDDVARHAGVSHQTVSRLLRTWRTNRIGDLAQA